MKFSEKWVREWVDPPVSTEALAEQLTMAGLEVDSIEPAAADFDNVVVGEVARVEPHPQADRLRVCQVNVGAAEPLSIVCGAPNVRQGMRVPTAMIGARLPGIKIKKSKLRGVESHGMLCSATELGLAESAEGLLPLPAEAPVGVSVRDYLGLDDHIIEVDFTPNRGDCLSVLGIAREIGVINRCAVKSPDVAPAEAMLSDTFPVELQAPADCPRYLGRVVKGVDPKAETPLWMRERLRRSGIRSLGPLVDVTNYVLLELGQPMHAFDLAKLNGGVVVRRAVAGEKLTLLDGKSITLQDDMLVIADHNAPVALAGIMGGEDSAMGDETCDIFLESAFFTPEVVRGRGRRFALQTDSSYRFERGVDPEQQRRAMERATALVLEIAGGQAGPVIEVADAAHLPVRQPITLRRERIARVLGVSVDDAQVEDILTRLGMAVEPQAQGWHVTSPAYRFDIAIEADLIEEIGRIFGYDQVPGEMPQGCLTMAARPEALTEQAQLRQTLVQRGYNEAITYSFVDPDTQRVLDPDNPPLILANPISSEMSAMRTTLWCGLLKAVAHNLNRQQHRVRLFETGLRFVQTADGLRQQGMVAGVAAGNAWPEQWGAPARAVDFFDIKGDVEALLGLTGCAGDFIFSPAKHAALHPGQSALISREGQEVGWLGALHPEVIDNLGLVPGTFVFELILERMALGVVPQFQGLSKFPSIRRDLAIVVDDEISAQTVCESVQNAAGGLLKDVHLFDVYRGKGIAEGKKSLALGITLQDYKRTLTDEEVEDVVERVMTALTDQIGASLRE